MNSNSVHIHKKDTPLYATELAIKHLGYYRVLFTSAVQFNSIIFRLAVGLLSGISETALALETSVEFLLNSIFEIPGGILADRIGRARCSILGLLGVASGLILMFFAIVIAKTNPMLSSVLVICDGVILGLSKPLFSGSIEAYYQSVIEKYGHLENPQIRTIISESFVRSGKYGKIIPSIALILSFSVAYILQSSLHIHYALLIGTVPYGIVCYWLIRDYRKFGDPSLGTRNTLYSHDVKKTLSAFSSNSKLRIASLLQSFYFLIYGPVMGYGLVSIGRALGKERTPWIILFSFMAGNLMLGWYLKGTVLPKMISNLKHHKTVILWLTSLLFLSLIMLTVHPYLDSIAWTWSIFIYMAFFQVTTSAITAVATNMTLECIPKSTYAITLSIQNMPSYLLFGIYSFYLAKFGTGAPSIEGLFFIESLLAFTLLCILSRSSLNFNDK